MQSLEDSTIRRFVLGDLDEESRRSIEAEVVGDEELFARIEAVEDEIIEEYVAGTLPASERRILVETLDAIPGRRQRAQLASMLAKRTAPAPESSNVVDLRSHLRFASHARFAVAAGFAAAAITALIFVQSRSSSPVADPPSIPAATAAVAPAAAPDAPDAQPADLTSTTIATRRPGGGPPLAQPSPASSSSVASVITLALIPGTSRGAEGVDVLDLRRTFDEVELEIAVDDDEYSHYNASLRAPDGSTLSAHRNIPVTASDGAPVISLRIPASQFREGRHELVLAGVHELGAEEVAYIEFDVRRR